MDTRMACSTVRWGWGLCALLVCAGLANACDSINGGDERGGWEVAWSRSFSGDYATSAQPVIDSERTYVALGPSLQCRSLEDGEKCWSTDMIASDQDLSAGEILESAGRLFVNDGPLVRAFAKTDGRLVWSTQIQDFRSTINARMAQNTSHLFLGGKGEVVRIRKDDGTVDLRIPVEQLAPDKFAQTAYEVQVDEGQLFVPTAYHRDSFEAIRGNVLVFNAQTGAYQWGYDVPHRYVKPPSVSDSIKLDADVERVGLGNERAVFAASQSVFALDRSTGEKKWDVFFKDDGFGESVVVKSGTAYVGSLGARVYAFDVRTGEQRWASREMGGSLFTILTAKHGRVYLGNEAGGQIWVLEAETGEVIWHSYPPEYATEGIPYTYVSPLAVGEEYMVNVGGRKIYALTIP